MIANIGVEFKFSDFFSLEHQTTYRTNGGFFLQFSDPPIQTLGKKFLYYSKSTNELRVVELETQTCTCASFQHIRRHYQKNLAARFCKCMLSVALEQGYCKNFKDYDEYIRAHLDDIAQFKSPHAHFLYRMADEQGNETLSASEVGNPWWNIFTKTKLKTDSNIRTGSVKKYGYADRWSYKSHPTGATNIRARVESLPVYHLEDQETTAASFSFEKLESLLALGHGSSASLQEHLRSLIYNSNNSNEILQSFIVAAQHLLLPIKELNIIFDAINRSFEAQSHSLPDNIKVAIANFLEGLVATLPLNRAHLPQNIVLSSISEIQSLLEKEAKIQSRSRLTEAIDNMAIGDLLDSEKQLFDALLYGKLKKEALLIINEPIPDWYDHAKGHAYIGYKYSNFADRIAKTTLKRQPEATDATILNYFTSLALADGSMSKVTLARMLYYKGYLAERSGNIGAALTFFRNSV